MPLKAEWIEFKLENIRKLSPDLIGVYECGYKKGNRVVYIGSGTVRARLLMHKAKVAFVGVTHFRRRTITSVTEARATEARLIKEFCKFNKGQPPKLNTQKPKVETFTDIWRI